MSALLDLISKQRQNISDKKVSSKNPYKWKQKETTVRILPGWRVVEAGEDIAPFSHPFGQMFIKDRDGKTLAVIADRRMSYGEDDAVRNLITVARGNATTDTERKYWSDMTAKQRYLVNALVLDDSAVNPNEAEILDFSETQYDTILSEFVKMVKAGEDPLDLENGFDLIVEKEGSGLLTKYKFGFARRSSKVNPKVMETVTDLDAFVRSKFADSERAINAIKSMTEGATLLPAPSDDTRAVSYGAESSKIVDAEYSAVTEASTVKEPVETAKHAVTQDELDALLSDI